MRKRKYTKEYLEPIVKSSVSVADILRKIGIKQTGGSHRMIVGRISEYNIETKHFTGQLWNKGKTKDTDTRVRKISEKISTPQSEVFCKNSGYKSSKLYKKLLELGWKNQCDICKILNWNGESIRFHVDHIDGNHTNNEFNNLRIICPNCHQQTKNWGVKNKY